MNPYIFYIWILLMIQSGNLDLLFVRVEYTTTPSAVTEGLTEFRRPAANASQVSKRLSTARQDKISASEMIPCY